MLNIKFYFADKNKKKDKSQSKNFRIYPFELWNKNYLFVIDKVELDSERQFDKKSSKD